MSAQSIVAITFVLALSTGVDAVRALDSKEGVAGTTYICPGNVYTDRISPSKARALGCEAVQNAPVQMADSPAPGCDSIKVEAKRSDCEARLMRKTLHSQVESRLKDPYSARFYDESLRWSDEPAVISLCGSVNAKNSYGAYSGKSGFISTSQGLVILEASESRELFVGAYQTWCSKPLRP